MSSASDVAPLVPSIPQDPEIEVLLEFKEMMDEGSMPDGWRRLHAGMRIEEAKVVMAEGKNCVDFHGDSHIKHIWLYNLKSCITAPGRMPDLQRCPRLEFFLGKQCDLKGPLPERWPSTLTSLSLSRNPNLWGTISKPLLAQCAKIEFQGCKQRWQCTAEEKDRGEWLQFPFIVGCTFASVDISSLLLHKSRLGITNVHLIDPPSGNDESFEMWRSHGVGAGKSEWCPWQEAWRNGLRELPKGSDVYVVPSTATHNTQSWFGIAEGSQFFQEKYEGSEAFDTKLKRDAVCFDPTYGIPAGESPPATILQWERRQIELAKAVRNNRIVLVHSSEAGIPDVSWYGLRFDKAFDMTKGVFCDL